MPRARHSLWKELNLAMSDLTPTKWKLYHRILRKERALCKLRKNYRSRKLEDLCDVDSDPKTQEISNCLNVEAIRLMAAIIRNSRHKPRGMRWNFKDKILFLSLVKRNPKSHTLLQILFHLLSGWTLQSLLNTVHFNTALIPVCLSTSPLSAENVWERAVMLSLVWWNVNQKESPV